MMCPQLRLPAAIIICSISLSQALHQIPLFHNCRAWSDQINTKASINCRGTRANFTLDVLIPMQNMSLVLEIVSTNDALLLRPMRIPFDYCALIEGRPENLLVKLVFETMRSIKDANIISACPVKKAAYFLNGFSMEGAAYLQLFTFGEFLITLQFYNENQVKVVEFITPVGYRRVTSKRRRV